MKYKSKRSYKLPAILLVAFILLDIYVDYGDGILFNMQLADYLYMNIAPLVFFFAFFFCSSRFTISRDGILLSSFVIQNNYKIEWEEIEKLYIVWSKGIFLGIKKKNKRRLIKKYLVSISKTELRNILYILYINGVNTEHHMIADGDWKADADKLFEEGKIPKFR